VVFNRTVRKSSLPKESTIFSVELYAIEMALNSIQNLPNPSFVIFSDSYCSLRTLDNPYTNHPVAKKILHQIDFLRTNENKIVKLCWVPSHVGIAQNELADAAANSAADLPEQHITLYSKDWTPIIKKCIQDAWTTTWKSINQKLSQIKQNTSPFMNPPNINRKKEVILTRLRAGHCRFSHGYLMDPPDLPNVAPVCTFCNDNIMSVRHILIDCPNLSEQRRILSESNTEELNISLVLGDHSNFARLFDFLTDIGLIDDI